MKRLLLGLSVVATAGCGAGGERAAAGGAGSPGAGGGGGVISAGAAGAAGGGEAAAGGKAEGGQAGGPASGGAGAESGGAAGGAGASGGSASPNCADIWFTNGLLGRSPPEAPLIFSASGTALSFRTDAVRVLTGAPFANRSETQTGLAVLNAPYEKASWVSAPLEAPRGVPAWTPDGAFVFMTGSTLVNWTAPEPVVNALAPPYAAPQWVATHTAWDGEAFWTLLRGADDDAAFYRIDAAGALAQPVTPLANKVYGFAVSLGAYRVRGAPGSGLVWLGGRGPSARAWNRQGAEVFPESVGLDDVDNPSIGVDDEGMWMMTRHLFHPAPDKPDSYRPQVYRFDNAGNLTSYPRPALPDWEGSDDGFAIKGNAKTAWLVVAGGTGIFLFEWDGTAMSPYRAVLTANVKHFVPGTSPTPNPYFGYYVRWRNLELFEVGEQRWIFGEDITGPGLPLWRALRVDDPSCVYESKRPYPG